MKATHHAVPYGLEGRCHLERRVNGRRYLLHYNGKLDGERTLEAAERHAQTFDTVTASAVARGDDWDGTLAGEAWVEIVTRVQTHAHAPNTSQWDRTVGHKLAVRAKHQAEAADELAEWQRDKAIKHDQDMAYGLGNVSRGNGRFS